MARFLKGINGAYSGKVGNVIGSSWRSIDYVRSLPKKSNKAASTAQRAQRAKFKLVINLLTPISDVLNLGFSDVNRTSTTAFNIAVQQALLNAVNGTYPTFSINYENIQISKGSLSPVLDLEVDMTTAQRLTLRWSTEVNRFSAFADDAIIVLLYHIDDQQFSIYEEAKRTDGILQISFPPTAAGKNITGWVFMGHRDGVKTSNSQFIGLQTIQ